MIAKLSKTYLPYLHDILTKEMFNKDCITNQMHASVLKCSTTFYEKRKYDFYYHCNIIRRSIAFPFPIKIRVLYSFELCGSSFHINKDKI